MAPEGNSNEENNNSGDPWTVPPPLAGGMSVDPSLFRHLPQVSVVNFSPLDIKAPETQLTKEAPQQQYQHPQPSVQEQPGLRSYEFGAGTAAAGAPVASSGCPSAPGLAHGDGTGNIGDGGDRRRKGRGLSGFSADTTKRLACPYYKRNPRKYCTWTSCPGPGWDEIHRVKFVNTHHERMSTLANMRKTEPTYTSATRCLPNVPDAGSPSTPTAVIGSICSKIHHVLYGPCSGTS